jgi:hypothetical protein
MKEEVLAPQPVFECRPFDVTAAARRLLIRRVFDLLGAPRGVLWWQTPHPDMENGAPLLRIYPQYDWDLHEVVFNATHTDAVFRTVGLVAARAPGATEDEPHSASVTATRRAQPTAPGWACHDTDGSSSWWLILLYVQGGLEPPWIRRYEEHFMGCPMCVYHIEVARLIRETFPGEVRLKDPAPEVSAAAKAY